MGLERLGDAVCSTGKEVYTDLPRFLRQVLVIKWGGEGKSPSLHLEIGRQSQA